jgi:alpha-methylacyl-CoA racemase
MGGPLEGLGVIELAGLGPGPFGGMMLADLGADVLLLDRVTREGDSRVDRPRDRHLQYRGRRSVAIDLKARGAKEVVLRLVRRADALIEPFRPGVAERLGIGPDTAMIANPRLVYARISGWGQNGPLAGRAGHDFNYVGLSGAAYHIRRSPEEIPVIPHGGLLGDYGGGGMLLAFGILAGVYEVSQSGKGQVVDVSIVDGALLISMSLYAQASFGASIGTSSAESGHYHQVYETSDGKYITLAAVEPKFYQELLRALGQSEEEMPLDRDPGRWPDLRDKMASIFRTRTRDYWCTLLENRDACFAPLLSPEEAIEHPHHRSRNSFVEIAGRWQPAPAPRFSRSQPRTPVGPPTVGADTAEALADWGFSDLEVSDLVTSGVLSLAPREMTG